MKYIMKKRYEPWVLGAVIIIVGAQECDAGGWGNSNDLGGFGRKK